MVLPPGTAVRSLRGTKKAEPLGRGVGCGIWKGLQFYLAVPRNQWRSQRRKDHPRAPRLPASSQQVSCRPASGSRPPLGSASAHKALRAPRAARASGSPAAGPSPAPRPPARSPAALPPPLPTRALPCQWLSRASARAARGGPGALGPQAQPGNQTEALACPPQHVYVCLARCPSA